MKFMLKKWCLYFLLCSFTLKFIDQIFKLQPLFLQAQMGFSENFSHTLLDLHIGILDVESSGFLRHSGTDVPNYLDCKCKMLLLLYEPNEMDILVKARLKHLFHIYISYFYKCLRCIIGNCIFSNQVINLVYGDS